MLDKITIPLTGPPEMPSTIAKNYIAKGIPLPSGRGFLAQWAYPGMTPEYVIDPDTKAPQVFGEESYATSVASVVMVRHLNRRGRRSKTDRYKRLTGPEFAVLMAEANLEPSFFAYIYGASMDRVMKWMDGVEDVPHAVRVMLEIIKSVPSAAGIAETVTTDVATERSPRKGAPR